ncbi:hypothetical protein OC835_005410 [Tilletia horrida]|nr:hypothetical protein OC835_005410 [Tilletia horrida]
MTLLDQRDRMVTCTLHSSHARTIRDGAYLLRQGYIATDPLRCYVGEEGCLRFVPEEINGTDPTSETLPWAKTLLNGIGVVTEVDVDRKTAVVQGMTFLGPEKKWCQYKVRLFATRQAEDPLQQFPRLLSLASFHAYLHRVGRDGVLEGRLQRIAYLQPAFSLLLGELGVLPGQLGKDRAIAALRRLNDDHEKVERLVNAVESVDSEDSAATHESEYGSGWMDRYGRRKRARITE